MSIGVRALQFPVQKYKAKDAVDNDESYKQKKTEIKKSKKSPKKIYALLNMLIYHGAVIPY